MMLSRAILCAAFVALAGCGANNNTIAGQAVGAIKEIGGKKVPSDPRAGLTRTALDNAEIRLIYIEVPKFPSKATLQEISRNRNQVTWQAVDGVQVVFERGILAATRGYGDDLIGADIVDVHAAARSGSGKNVIRIHDYLTSAEQIERKTFVCNYSGLGSGSISILGESVPVRSVAEICQDAKTSFENTYHWGRDGRLVASRQWVSETVGHVISEELSR